MNIRELFRRRKKGDATGTTPQEPPQPLRIEGIPDAPLTPEPDDAELAAQALLEALSLPPAPSHKGGEKGGRNDDITSSRNNDITSSRDNDKGSAPPARDAEYFRHLAAKIKQARQSQRLRTVRFVAFCEQELRNRRLPAYGPGSLGLLEAELLKRLDVIEREGGDLKRRWQHCLTEVTVRLMKAQASGAADPYDGDNDNDNDGAKHGDHG